MAKGQQRSNKEHKKPKQPKPLPAPPRSAFTAPPGKAGPSGKKP
jgi:hypothetical protein